MSMLDMATLEEWKGDQCPRCQDFHKDDPDGCRDPDCPMHKHFEELEKEAALMDEALQEEGS